MKEANTSLEQGRAIIDGFVKTLPDTPGVYRMLNAKGDALYIGKAKSLRKRVTSYTKTDKLPVRLQRMVAETQEMVFVQTHTEVEALLLESNLIKKLKPYYNVLLRDDKSFPYILLTGNHDFPLLTKHRGARKKSGDYFGPFAAGGAVNNTIVALQKAFMLRNCSDNVFAQRKRPCLQYQIKRCTAPCVGKVTKKQYAQQVSDAKKFLSGKSRAVQDSLADAMQDASDRMDYEGAAQLRDRIKALTAIQARQGVNIDGIGDADVLGLYEENGRSCVQVFFFRGGQNFGNRAYFPRHSDDDTSEEIVAAFIAQFYENKAVPPDIIVSHVPAEKSLLEEALQERSDKKKKISIVTPQRGARKQLLTFAVDNARGALERETVREATEKELLEKVAALFELEDIPQRVEVYDNSHIGGNNMVGAMIVAGPEGLRKNAYRKFNQKQAADSDDYAMMREVMERRFGKALQEGKESDWPDLVLIDGGPGQLSAVYDVLEELGIADRFAVVAIAKGQDRNAGRERFFVRGRDEFQLPVNDPVLHYLQRLRDEAHRFAVGAHRARRVKAVGTSPLDQIAGVGAKRKKALLHHFGSAQAVAKAGIADLTKVDGVSEALAQKVYDYFHES